MFHLTTARAFSILIFGAVFLFCAGPSSADDAVPMEKYLEYARATADGVHNNFSSVITAWKKSFDPLNVFGYRPPGGLLETAVIYATLYEMEKRPEYAERAKKILLTYGDYRSVYPESSIRMRSDYEEGVPALPDFFTVMRYIRAYDTLRRLDYLNSEENARAADLIAHSMRYLLRTQEWGPMNRAALRAESLAWAVRALPDHPERPVWDMQRRALGDDNWGNWQIEDASLYNAVWLYALLGYADALGRSEELLKTPEMVYYARYFLELMCPAGMIPDFGDSHWMSNWPHFLVSFEAFAAHHRCPELKWAASVIARKFIDFDSPGSAGLGYMLLDAYRWGSDKITPAPPTSLSGEVLEDIVGKKIVFRDGWKPDSTYMLLNYRDEGDGGLNFRDYLRDSIPVEEEKMTHGHADENSIILLMSDGSVLLRDGGYRDYMPSGPLGAYRQDYFHNRLCVRPEKIFMGQREGEYRYSVRDAVPGQGILEFFQNAGSYRRVRTQKIDILTFEDFDYSRTRLIDDAWGYESDRIVVYVKDPEFFVVFDVFKSRREEYFTLANLWHTRQILSSGPGWFDTAYDRIGKEELPPKKSLLVVFPRRHFRMEGVEPIRRHGQDEQAVYQAAAQHFEMGETAVLITVLFPKDRAADPGKLVQSVSLTEADPERHAAGVRITAGGKAFTIGIKNDLRMDIARDWRRPRYTYEAGKIRIGDVETNGDFVFASESGGKLSYTIVNLTKAFYRGQALVQAAEAFFGLAFDASPDQPGRGKLRYWRETVPID
ncbi:MAG: hypothetical protein SCM96_13680 [Acidobacteriota bacterium]|nr:hypothetical protein [Acidobacteriota bacterium]